MSNTTSMLVCAIACALLAGIVSEKAKFRNAAIGLLVGGWLGYALLPILLALLPPTPHGGL